MTEADEVATLEERARTTHRLYLAAFIEWETLVTDAPGGSDPIYAQACAAAESRKESYRVALRDLIDELGFLPAMLDPKLPAA